MSKIRPNNRLLGYLGIIAATISAGLFLKTFVVDAFCVSSASMESTLIPGDYIFVNKLVYGAKMPNRLSFSRASFSSYRFPSLNNISRGDIIVFELPLPNKSSVDPTYFVKRCIGIPGDTVALLDGKIFVNGKVFSIPSMLGKIADQFGSVIVPKRGITYYINKENYSMIEKVVRLENHSVGKQSDSMMIVDGKSTTTYIPEKNYLFVLGDNINHSSDSREWGFLPEDNVVGEAIIVYWSSDGLFSSVCWNRIGNLIN